MRNLTTERAETKQVRVTVRDGSVDRILFAASGTSLLDVLRDSGLTVVSPCGGMGNCKKCLVDVGGNGKVLACSHILDRDIEVTLPVLNFLRILEDGGIKVKPVSVDSGISTTEDAGNTSVWHEGKMIARHMNGGNRPFIPLGAAIDIGTTTVAVYVEDLSSGTTKGIESFGNPQASAGGDVVSRIHFTMQHRTGLARLQAGILAAINRALTKVCRTSGMENDSIFKLTVVGNPTMLHLFFGVDPSSLASAPFTPVFTKEMTRSGSAMGLAVNPGAVVRSLPSVAGYVGADVVAGVASTPLADEQALSLYVDIGTNGEMALGNRDIIFCCATAAGPAFEGARISCGVAGVDGAICSFKDGAYETISGRPAVGICGSGIIDIVAGLLDRGEIDAGGFMETAAVIERGGNTGCGNDIVLTPADVREVQLAKAAIASGIKILLKEAGAEPGDITRVYCAGAFGNFMDVSSAVRIGMIPRELAGRIECVGNAAGTGARLALRSRGFERSLKRIVDISSYIELSGRSDFNDMFVGEMGF
jgi:uncharacterized 2Fe-2S/4Fe-4S cluster protein (DUF4445 family)